MWGVCRDDETASRMRDGAGGVGLQDDGDGENKAVGRKALERAGVCTSAANPRHLNWYSTWPSIINRRLVADRHTVQLLQSPGSSRRVARPELPPTLDKPPSFARHLRAPSALRCNLDVSCATERIASARWQSLAVTQEEIPLHDRHDRLR